MDRLRRVADLWNWLPAFRAVAETEAVRVAADRLHISPSALSRTIKLLEEDLGRPLFERIGGRLKINADGEILLAAVRDSMRRVHDATLRLESRVLAGDLRISAAGTLTVACVVPALDLLRRDRPQIVPLLETGTRPDPVAALLMGDVDVVFSSSPIADPNLSTVLLGESSNGIYCAKGHPLHGAEAVTPEELASHPFVAPPERDGVPVDAWPAELPRVVGTYVTSLHVGLELCRQGRLLAVLPDLVVSRVGAREALFRLPFDGLTPVKFFACHRPTIGDGGAAEAAVDAARNALALRG